MSDTDAFSGGIGPALPAGVPPCAGGYFGDRGWLLRHDQPARRLYALSTSVATGAVWSELGGTRAGHLSAAHVDRPNDRLLVGSDTGEIVASTDLTACTVLDDVALGPLAVDLTVEALGVLPGGALVAVVLGQGWSQSLVVVRSPP